MDFSDIVNIQHVPTINDLPKDYLIYITRVKIEEGNKQFVIQDITRTFSHKLDCLILESFMIDTAETWKASQPWNEKNCNIIDDITHTEIKEGTSPIIYYPLKLWGSVRTAVTLPTNNEEFYWDFRTVTSEKYDSNDIGINWIGSIKLNDVNNAYLFKDTYATIYIHFSTKQEDEFSALYTMNLKLVQNYPTTHVRILDVS